MTSTPDLPLTLREASGVPFYRQIETQLMELIRTGALPPGRQLPSVRELALQLQVSVITTRRAYADLEAAGLVDRRQGRGTFVAENVAAASTHAARDEVRRVFAAAVDTARRLGLCDDAQRQLLEDLLGEESQ